MSSKKLKKAMAEISAILEKYDIAGAIAIHTPGVTDFKIRLDPSYSCASVENDALKILGKLEHYGGNREHRDAKVAATANMLDGLSRQMGIMSLNLMEASKSMGEKMGVEHYAPIENPDADEPEEPLNSNRVQFKATARITLEPTGKGITNRVISSDFRLDTSGNIDTKRYVDERGLPTELGTRSVTMALVGGLVGNIHSAHQKGWWDSAEHIRHIIDQLSKGFVETGEVTEGLM